MGWLTGGTTPKAPDAREAPTSDARPAIGTVDVLEASLGARGMGKSTHQCKRALELCNQFGGAYVIGHSLGARLPPRLPKELGGDTLPIKYHDSIVKLERGLRRSPDQWHVLAPPLSKKHRDTADDLLRFTIRFSDSLRRDAWKRAHPMRLWNPMVSYSDVPCTPTVVIVDEGIAVDAAGPSRKEDTKWFLEYLYSLRHNHLALLWAIQDATSRSWRVLEQATAIHVFRVRHAWALQAIQAAGANPDEVERIRRLEKHQHVTLSFETPTEAAIPDAMRDA